MSKFKIKIRELLVGMILLVCIPILKKSCVKMTPKSITQFVYRNLMSSLPPFPVKVCQ